MRISDWSSDVCSSDLLRKLEEMELRREKDALEKERGDLEQLLGSETRQRTRLKRDLTKIRDRYGPETALGKRRTLIEQAGPARDIPLEAMIEREPITVIMRSEEHTSELQSLMRISYAVFCLKTKPN